MISTGFGLDDRFAYQPYNHLVTPNERLNMFAKGEYDLTETTTFRVLASYNNRKSQGQAAPVPLFWGPDSGSTPYMVNVIWDKDQIYNPFGMDLGPDNLQFMTHRPVEIGPRIFDQDVDTWYVSGWIGRPFWCFGQPHVLGHHRNLVGEQRQADQVQPVQCPQHQHRTG